MKNMLWRHIESAYNLEVNFRGQIELSPARKVVSVKNKGVLKHELAK